MINKQKIVELIRVRLEEEVQLITQAAKAAHEAATHEESKAEDSHDTRGIESSYLAGAQAQRASEIQQQIHAYKVMKLKEFSTQDPIAATALVELRSDTKRSLYFIAPQGGGMKVQLENDVVQVITPHSPLGEELVGRRTGDTVEVEAQGGSREYEITSVH
jgi:transcription elongation GreA/GreB family factor